MIAPRLVLPALLVVAGWCGFRTARAEDWPHWRGARRDAVVNEPSGWRDGRWLADRPRWTAELGTGATSPIVVGNRVFAIGWRDGSDRVACLDLATGRQLWAQSYACPELGRFAMGDENFYRGPSSTPSYDQRSERLFTLSIDGDLRAWDASDGRAAWRLNLYDEFGVGQRPKVGRAARRDYGYTSSPLVWGETVIVEVGDDEGTLMAFDARSGRRRWTSQFHEPAGHSGSPVPLSVEGLPCVAALTIRHLLVARLDAGHEGETLATYPWETNFANNIPTPAIQGPYVLVTSKYNHQSMGKLKITRRGAEKVWEAPYSSGVCSPVIRAGRVYWSSHRAYCLDFQSGKLVWEGGRFGDAGSCLVTSDDKLIVWARQGTLALLDAAPAATAFRELARRELPAPSDVWPHVVLSGGRLLCKTREGTLTCW